MKKSFVDLWREFWHGDAGTKIRIILLVLTWANQIIAVIGQTSFASERWYQITSLVVSVLITAITAWENNDITYFAKLGTQVLDALQDGKVTEDEVLEILEEGSEEKK